MSIQIIPFTQDLIVEAADLFSKQVAEFRNGIPALPDVMEKPEQVTPYLERIIKHGTGLAAMGDNKLVGYFTWFWADNFRDTHKMAAYVPEWGHCVTGDQSGELYSRLYAQAASLWSRKAYPIWAITCLVNNHFMETFLYHNGFGMIVQDGVRSIHFQAEKLNDGLKVRKCSVQDAAMIADLDMEHCRHYSQAPVLMTPRKAETMEAVREFLAGDGNSYWTAEENGLIMGFMRFESGNKGAATVVRSEKTVAITGAYIQPQYRGRRAALTLLHHALADYAQKNYLTCSVDYETINPEAYGFWPRYFQTVCFSVVRYPEKFLC